MPSLRNDPWSSLDLHPVPHRDDIPEPDAVPGEILEDREGDAWMRHKDGWVNGRDIVSGLDDVPAFAVQSWSYVQRWF